MTAMESSGGSLPLVNLALCLDLDFTPGSTPEAVRTLHCPEHVVSAVGKSQDKHNDPKSCGQVECRKSCHGWSQGRETRQSVIVCVLFQRYIKMQHTTRSPLTAGRPLAKADGSLLAWLRENEMGGRVSSFSGSSPDGWTHLGGARTGQEPWRISGVILGRR